MHHFKCTNYTIMYWGGKKQTNKSMRIQAAPELSISNFYLKRFA